MDSDLEDDLPEYDSSDDTDTWEPELDPDLDVQCSMRDGQEYYDAHRIHPAYEFRVLKLLPGDFHDDVYCELAVISRLYLESSISQEQETGGRYEYDALSYTWGSWEDCRFINWEGVTEPFGVTQHLYHALLHLRRRDEPQWLWIDQLCINQASVNERNQQVPLMDKIYSMASRVLVWLGHSDKGTPTQRDNKDESNSSISKELAYMQAVVENSQPRWWERAWVVQEVAMARQDPTFICGPYKMAYHLRYLAYQPTDDGSTNFIRSLKAAAQDFRFCGFGSRERTSRHVFKGFVSVANILLSTTSSDFRDKVYAFLGLLDSSLQERIAPDYERPVGEVFAAATEAEMTCSQSFEILSLVSRHTEPSQNLPSWVYDFARPGYIDDHSFLCASALETGITMRNLRSHFKSGWTMLRAATATSSCALDKSDMSLTIREQLFDRVRFGTDWCLHNSTSLSRQDFRSFAAEWIQGLSLDLLWHVPFGSWPFQALRDACGPQSQIRPHKTSMSSKERNVLSEDYIDVAFGDRARANITAQDQMMLVALLFRCWRYALRAVQDSPVGYEYTPLAVEYNLLEKWHAYIRFVGGKGDIFTTDKGFWGVAPSNDSWEDTWIVLPYGSSAPMILQDVGEGKWKFRGLAYVNGIMHNELHDFMPGLELEERDFRII